MSGEPDFIVTSGRESLPVLDRAALLNQEMEHLRRLRSTDSDKMLSLMRATKPSARTAQETKIIADVSHDVHAMGVLTSSIFYACTAILRGDIRLDVISRLECRVMAYKRGGHKEFNRVSAAQFKIPKPRVVKTDVTTP